MWKPVDRYDERTAKNVETLHPDARRKTYELLTALRKAGIEIVITDAARTWEQQAALYAQGRTTSGKIVTNAKAGDSLHNYFVAFDSYEKNALKKGNFIGFGDIKGAVPIAKSLGFDTIPNDKPHLQITFGMPEKQFRAKYKDRVQRPTEFFKVALLIIALFILLNPKF